MNKPIKTALLKVVLEANEEEITCGSLRVGDSYIDFRIAPVGHWCKHCGRILEK